MNPAGHKLPTNGDLFQLLVTFSASFQSDCICVLLMMGNWKITNINNHSLPLCQRTLLNMISPQCLDNSHPVPSELSQSLVGVTFEVAEAILCLIKILTICTAAETSAAVLTKTLRLCLFIILTPRIRLSCSLMLCHQKVPI